MMNIRDRQFLLGSLYQIKKLANSRFSSVEKKLQSVFGKTLSVKVTNPVKQLDYGGRLDALKTSFDKAIKVLEDIKNKEIDVSDLKKLDDIKQAVRDIEIPQPKDIEFSPLQKQMVKVEEAVKAIKIPKTELNTDPVVSELKKIQRELSLIDMPDINIPNLDVSGVIKELQELRLQLASTKQHDVKIDLNPVIDSLEELKETIAAMPRTEAIEFPESIAISNFPPQKVPQPVTNININPIRGLVHTTATTVTTTLTPLPGYGVLDNRRSLIFFNNSASVTVYIGGSDVTTGNGIPVLAQTFSPAFDSGPTQLWYGLTASSTADIRTVEVANDSGG